MQLKGRYALLVHVWAVYTVVRIGLNFVKFNVFTVFTFSAKNVKICVSVKYQTISTLTFIDRPVFDFNA